MISLFIPYYFPVNSLLFPYYFPTTSHRNKTMRQHDVKQSKLIPSHCKTFQQDGDKNSNHSLTRQIHRQHDINTIQTETLTKPESLLIQNPLSKIISYCISYIISKMIYNISCIMYYIFHVRNYILYIV